MHISKNDYAFCKSYQQVVTVMAAIADIAAAWIFLTLWWFFPFCAVSALLRYPKPTPTPGFLESVRHRNLGFSIISGGFQVHLYAKAVEFNMVNVCISIHSNMPNVFPFKLYTCLDILSWDKKMISAQPSITGIGNGQDWMAELTAIHDIKKGVVGTG